MEHEAIALSPFADESEGYQSLIGMEHKEFSSEEDKLCVSIPYRYGTRDLRAGKVQLY